MSPDAGKKLVEKIAPIIRYEIRKGTAHAVGAEDWEELTADCIAQAARILHVGESHAKYFPASVVAKYALQRTRYGQRSYGKSFTDVMAPRTTFKGNVNLRSLDMTVREIGRGDDDGVDSLHDVLAARQEDPACKAGRRIDWAEMLVGLDKACIDILCCMVERKSCKEIAKKYGRGLWWVNDMKNKLKRHIRSRWDKAAMEDALKDTFWKRHIGAHREREICRAERALA